MKWTFQQPGLETIYQSLLKSNIKERWKYHRGRQKKTGIHKNSSSAWDRKLVVPYGKCPTTEYPQRARLEYIYSDFIIFSFFTSLFPSSPTSFFVGRRGTQTQGFVNIMHIIYPCVLISLLWFYSLNLYKHGIFFSMRQHRILWWI